MFKRELKTNFKSFLIWTLILLGLFLVVYLIYPYIMTSENTEMLNEMIKIFPPEMLKAFNMDISEIDTAYGNLYYKYDNQGRIVEETNQLFNERYHYYYDDNLDQFYWHDTELNKYRELPYISLKNGSRYVWAYETNGNRVAILIHKFKQLYNLE